MEEKAGHEEPQPPAQQQGVIHDRNNYGVEIKLLEVHELFANYNIQVGNVLKLCSFVNSANLKLAPALSSWSVWVA